MPVLCILFLVLVGVEVRHLVGGLLGDVAGGGGGVGGDKAGQGNNQNESHELLSFRLYSQTSSEQLIQK